VTPQKVVLRGDVAGIGKRGDVVEVSAGYARNFLVPRGLAFAATEGAERQAEAMRRNRMLKDQRDREAAQEIAKQLVSTPIRVSARAGSGGKLFGSITASDITGAVLEQTRVSLERKSIRLDEAIKTTGSHQVSVHLHSEVEFPITVEVSAS
jgi:large subunit ribosomal protein L9